MAFCGQVNNAIYVIFLHELLDEFKITDVTLHEGVVWCILDVLQIGKIACVSQFVEIDDVIVWIFCDEKSNDMATDKSSATCDDDITFHIPKIFVNG